jgi:peptidoglycan hydrolase-like protein with peptidoglycan-binding domain
MFQEHPMKAIRTTLFAVATCALAVFASGCAAADDAADAEFSESTDELNARVMKLGDAGPDVAEMQGLFLKIGYELSADGKFGPGTESIVANFQTRNKIQATKQVGATTMTLLRNVAQATSRVAPLALPSGYYEVSVDKMRVVNNCKILPGGKPVDARPGSVAPSAYGDYDLVVNGTFSLNDTSDNSTRTLSAGTIVRGGVVEGNGFGKTVERGGLAILKDGSIRLVRQRGAGLAGVQAALGTRALDSFMGGGALLIENGQLVTSDDLLRRQKFDQGDGGIDSAQMFEAQRTLVAIDASGRAHIVISLTPKRADTMRQDLLKLGIVNAVMFDGSSGFVARTKDKTALGGANGNCCSGFAVKIAR